MSKLEPCESQCTPQPLTHCQPDCLWRSGNLDHGDLNCGRLEFQVVDLNVKSLLGLSDSIKLDLVSIGSRFHTIQQGAPQLSKYKELFDCDTVGKILVLCHMQIDESVTPSLYIPRRVPLTMKDKVIAELDRMTKQHLL